MIKHNKNRNNIMLNDTNIDDSKVFDKIELLIQNLYNKYSNTSFIDSKEDSFNNLEVYLSNTIHEINDLYKSLVFSKIKK